VRQLILLAPEAPICIAVGHRASEVEAAVDGLSPSLVCVQAPQTTATSLLHSLTAALDRLADHADLQGAWVLFADTLYHPDALVRLIQSVADSPVLASQPVQAEASAEPIGVLVEPGSQRLLALGPAVPSCDGVMAAAVYWPRSSWSFVKAAVARGLVLQWQVLRDYQDQGPVTVLPLRRGQTRDIDTPADAGEALGHLRDPLAVSFFRRSISKDERNLSQGDRITSSAYRKVCMSEGLALCEAHALDWLHGTAGCRVPARLDRQGRILLLEPIHGIRLYDLLRLLRSIERLRPEQAAQARAASLQLLRRSLEQLWCLQRALLAWPLAHERPAYPLSSHLAGLLATLLRLLGLPSLQPGECRELRGFDRLWRTADVLIPFRDATAKNTIVLIPELAPRAAESSGDRIAKIVEWLDRDESASVPLVDIDFTSVVHRTAPEDDLFSLLAHAGSLPVGRRLLAELVPSAANWPTAVADLVSWIDPAIRRDGGRAARALLVRYLRFGGRKLLYRILNPAAFCVRFRYDDPVFYFRQLPHLLSQLDPGFHTSFPCLSARLDQLSQTVSLLPAWRDAEAGQDLYRSQLGASLTYWQESPLEIPDRGAPSLWGRS